MIRLDIKIECIHSDGSKWTEHRYVDFEDVAVIQELTVTEKGFNITLAHAIFALEPSLKVAE